MLQQSIVNSYGSDAGLSMPRNLFHKNPAFALSSSRLPHRTVTELQIYLIDGCSSYGAQCYT